MEEKMISVVPYLIISGVGTAIILMVWLFLRAAKYKEWYKDLSISYKKVVEDYMLKREDLALAIQTTGTMNEQIQDLSRELVNTKESLSNMFSQKKSSEVRLGKDAEVLTPFLDVFPYNPKYARFVGEPLDFIIFDPDKEITFVEVKSGNSKLSPKQNKLKKLIEEGKVKFDLIRIKA